MCGQYEVTFCSFYTFKVGITFFIFPHHLYSLRLELRYLQCLIVNRCGNIMRYVSKNFFFFFLLSVPIIMRMKRSQNQFLWLKVPNKSREQRCAPYFKLVYSSLVVTCNIICMVFIPRDDFRQMDFETCNFYKFRPALFLILRLNFEVIIVTFEVVIFSMFCTWTGVVLMNSNRSKKAHRSLDHRAKIKAGAICLVSLETFNIEISFENYARIMRELRSAGN